MRWNILTQLCLIWVIGLTSVGALGGRGGTTRFIHTPEFQRELREFRQAHLDLPGEPATAIRLAHLRVDKHGTESIATLLKVGERRIWAEVIAPTTIAKVMELEHYGLQAQVNDGFSTPDEFARWLSQDENLRPRQVRYIQLSEQHEVGKLKGAFGPDYLAKLKEAGLLLEEKNQHWEPTDNEILELRLGGIRLVSGFEATDVPGAFRHLPLPHFSPEKLRKLESSGEAVPELPYEIGRARVDADGISALGFALAGWVIAREAKRLGVPSQKVGLLVWTRTRARARYYKMGFGMREFDADHSVQPPEFWMSLGLDGVRDRFPSRALDPGSQLVADILPNRTEAQRAGDIADLKRRTRMSLELQSNHGGPRIAVEIRAMGRYLKKMIWAWHRDLGGGARSWTSDMDRLNTYFHDRMGWGYARTEFTKDFGGDEWNADLLASRGMDAVLAAKDATPKSVMDAFGVILKEAEAGTRRKLLRFAAFVEFPDQAPTSQQAQILTILQERLGAQIRISGETQFYYPQHRFIFLEAPALEKLREYMKTSENSWVALSSQQGLLKVQARPSHL